MNWFLLNSGPGTPAFNMALDEALLERVGGFGQPVLRFYGWTVPAATFGHLQKYAAAGAATGLRPLIRRPTGGGVVPHDADWTYSLLVPPDHAWYSLPAVGSYRRMHIWIQAAFGRLALDTELAPTARRPVVANANPLIPGACFVGHEQFDLLWRGKKIAGAAQRRNRCGLLIQGSVQSPRTLPRAAWEEAMLEAARNDFGVVWGELPPSPDLLARAAELAREKFSQDSYNRKR